MRKIFVWRLKVCRLSWKFHLFEIWVEKLRFSHINSGEVFYGLKKIVSTQKKTKFSSVWVSRPIFLVKTISEKPRIYLLLIIFPKIVQTWRQEKNSQRKFYSKNFLVGLSFLQLSIEFSWNHNCPRRCCFSSIEVEIFCIQLFHYKTCFLH